MSVKKDCSACLRGYNFPKWEHEVVPQIWVAAYCAWFCAGFLAFCWVLFNPPNFEPWVAVSLVAIAWLGPLIIFWRVGIRSTIVGKYFYLLSDGDETENYHIHEKGPEEMYYNPDQSSLKLPTILRIRVGGWFKKNRIYGPRCQYWEIESWTGTDVLIRDKNHATLRTNNLRLLLQTVDDFMTVAQMEDHHKQTALEARQYSQRLQEIQAHMLDKVVELAVEALRDKERAGRSQHVTKIRKALQTWLKEELGAKTVENYVRNTLIAEDEIRAEILRGLTA